MRFDVYKDEINARNAKKLRTFTAYGLMLSLLNAVAELAQLDVACFFDMTVYLVLYFFALHMLFMFWYRPRRHVTLLFYFIEFPLMALAICLGTFQDPQNPAVAIMVFLCVMPLFILDKPWRIGLYITVSAAAYAVASYNSKDTALYRYDMVNLAAYWLVAMGINYFTLKERIDSVETYVHYREKSEHDILTGTFNRGGGDERIKRFLANGTTGAFLILDIDSFKQINDRYGHIVGDEVLVAVAACLRRSFRAADVVMRMGGDEFAVYAAGLTECSLCKEKLDRLRAEIAALTFSGADGLRVSISVGCVFNRGSFVDYMTLYKRCDMCLYMAKKNGKDRYVFA